MSTLINHHAMYRQSGERAGRALRKKDFALWKNECAWFERAVAAEPAERREELRKVWQEAYRLETNPRTTVVYF